MAILKVDKISTYYGNIQALREISLSVEEGEIVTRITSYNVCYTKLLRGRNR